MTHHMTVRELIDSAEGGFKGLLAAEILQKTDRQSGPVDDKCEVCGEQAESFVLQDWTRWHCHDCTVLAVEHDAGFHFEDVYMDCDACAREWKEIAA
jgi:hypothetical protein